MQGKCVACPAANPKFDGTKCVECPLPSYWNEDIKDCVNCTNGRTYNPET